RRATTQGDSTLMKIPKFVRSKPFLFAAMALVAVAAAHAQDAAPAATEAAAAAAPDPIAAAVEAAKGELQTNINTVWTCAAAFLVFFMQAGFAMVETGFTRSKNAVNIL